MDYIAFNLFHNETLSFSYFQFVKASKMKEDAWTGWGQSGALSMCY